MKNSKTNMIAAGGVDDTIQAPLSKASSIINLRWNAENSSWTNDRSFQPWWKFPASFTWDTSPAPAISGSIFLGKQVDSVYFWQKATGEVYVLIEQGGVLYAVYGNKGQGATYTGFSYFFDDIVVIATGRSTKPSQYIPFGNRLLIINGFDDPIWMKSPFSHREFGFSFPAPRAEVINVQADYPQNKPLASGTGAPFFASDSLFGLGDTTGKKNNYFWKVSYILDSGSESPLSSYSNISWIVPVDATYEEYKFGVSMELPITPKGTVARRLYRTKNCLNNEETYYFVKEIKENGSSFHIDIIEDTYLVTSAPSTLASSIITTDYRFGESWDGRIWLAKERKIVYSDKGLPEQFNAVSFFDLGSTVGGNITAIKAYYNNLVVFRESAINIIRFGQNGGYSLATVSTSTGSISPRAITVVPNLGLTFVNEEGVWSLVGGFDGGSTLQIRKISHDIDNEWNTLNKSSLSNVIAAYSFAEKELWIHFPYGYNNTPTRGVVLHLERGDISWSFRKSTNQANDLLYNFSALTTDFDGRFVFGSVPNWSSSWDTLNATNNLFGPLHVWCASPYHSQTVQLTNKADDIYTYTVSELPVLAAEYESTWFEYQNGMLQVYSVEIEIIAQGDTKVIIDYKKDFELDFTTTAAQKQADGKTVFTKNEPPVSADPAAYLTITKNPFTINTSQLYNERRVKLRFDVRAELCDNFKFKLRSNILDKFELIGFKIDYRSKEIPVMNQSIRLNKGQAR